MSEKNVLDSVEALRPNPYIEFLGDYLKSLDLRIQRELLTVDQAVYNPNRLSLSDQYLDLYRLYLFSIIDFLNGEYGRYENSAAAFNNVYSTLKRENFEKIQSPKRSFMIWKK